MLDWKRISAMRLEQGFPEGSEELGGNAVSDMDIELLRRWSAGEQRAGAELIRRHADIVHRFLRKRSGADAEDLTQQTFLACLEGADRFGRAASFRAYLLGVARHLSHIHYRRMRRVQQLTTSMREQSQESAPLSSISAHPVRQDVALAIGRLSPQLQQVLELCYWHGLSQVQIAKSLNLPVGTVASRLRRAKEKLRQVLMEMDFAEMSAE